MQQHGMVELQLQFPGTDAATLSNVYAAAGESLDDARQVSPCLAKVSRVHCNRRGKGGGRQGTQSPLLRRAVWLGPVGLGDLSEESTWMHRSRHARNSL